jgi:hypothetical protein
MTGEQFNPQSVREADALSRHAQRPEDRYLQPVSGWVAWVEFAAIMLILVGGFHVIQGLVALFRDEVYVVSKERLVLGIDYTGWGWIHLIGGVIVILVGAGLLGGRMIARILGVAAALVSALINVAFMPAFPVWSMMMIAIDVLVIWAIIVHGGELRRAQD